MVAMQTTLSLTVVKTELEKNLTRAEKALESLSEQPDQPSLFESIQTNFAEVSGVLNLLQLSGAKELAGLLVQLSKALDPAVADDFKSNLALGAKSVIALHRYLEYVQLKGSEMPVLLAPVINDLNKALRQQPIFESDLVELSVQAEQVLGLPEPQSPQLNSNLIKLAKFYRSAFSALLKGGEDQKSLMMMAKVMVHLQRSYSEQEGTYVWMAAQAALEVLGSGQVELNGERKLVLGALEQLIRQQASTGSTVTLDQRLLKSLLYVSALAGDHALAEKARSHFGVEALSVTEAQLNTEKELMNGPGASVICTVAGELRASLAAAKAELVRIAESDAPDYTPVAEALSNTAQTLIMLGLIKESHMLKQQSEQVLLWGNDINGESTQFHQFTDEVLAVENAIALLEKQYQPGEDSESKDTSISLYQLDDARKVVVAECRSGLSLAKRAISSYLDSDCDTMHLNNVPATLASVAGGVLFLELPRVERLLKSSQQFVERVLSEGTQASLTPDQIEALADTISCVDYYLESMEQNQPIGEGVLDTGEASVAQLVSA